MTSTKLTLLYPIELDDGSVVRALMVRRPSREDVLEIRLAAYAVMTGLDRRVIDELDLADIRRLDIVLDEISTFKPKDNP
ncbi:hypothetical protein GIW81_02080 [Hyphomicrobium sp. xq]|uniref:Uncharacterized protein n=1 Tax=Hyphomicrobium album TaxID=2665159 RepID=A0A6I3KEY4_9HYPH|nr:phage tail assembly protein [Hyphomicrobium album]MTD93118.1 hypothetical protein [Hyphomicrobium album]